MWHACVLGVFTCVFLLCTPGWAQAAVSSYLLSLPPALPRTFLYSELSPGSFPLEQLCAALGARDRLRSFPSSILWRCLTLPTTQSSKRLNSSPLRTEATQAFLPRGLHSHAPPSLTLCPSLTPCFLNPRHKDFFSSYFCDFFSQPILRSGILREGSGQINSSLNIQEMAVVALSITNNLASCVTWPQTSMQAPPLPLPRHC